jgi:hypothetical protein
MTRRAVREAAAPSFLKTVRFSSLMSAPDLLRRAMRAVLAARSRANARLSINLASLSAPALQRRLFCEVGDHQAMESRAVRAVPTATLATQTRMAERTVDRLQCLRAIVLSRASCFSSCFIDDTARSHTDHALPAEMRTRRELVACMTLWTRWDTAIHCLHARSARDAKDAALPAASCPARNRRSAASLVWTRQTWKHLTALRRQSHAIAWSPNFLP